MKDLIKYIKAYKIKAILAPIFKMLEACFELIVPLVIARMVDEGISKSDKSVIISSGVILILLTTVGYIAALTAQYFAARAAMGFGNSLRSDLFRRIIHLSYSDVDRVGTSTLITRMTSDVNHVITGVNMFLRLFLRSPFIVIGAVVMAFTVDRHTSMVFLVCIPILTIVVCFITYASIPLYRKVQEKLDRVTLLTREGLIGIRVIRAFNREEIEEREFSSATDELQKAQLRVGRMSALMNPVTYLIVELGIAALIYFGAVRVDAGLLTRGQVIALVNYMSQILIELVKLANLIITLTKAMASARRISDVMNISPEEMFSSEAKAEASSETAERHFLEFDNVSMSYSGSRQNSIEDISFTADKGEIIGIIGGTGSGKSTLVNLIPAFYKTTEGRVILDGRSVNDYSPEELRNRIGIVPQKSALFAGTIAYNLKMSKPDATEQEMKEALRLSQAAEFVETRKEGLDYELTQGGKNLSGGQRQRMCIARALVRNPEVLILDDSSSALDYATEAALRNALNEIKKDRVIIIVSQRASSLIYADRILVLDDGRIVGMGSHSELYKDCDIYREIYHTQFSEGGEAV